MQPAQRLPWRSGNRRRRRAVLARCSATPSMKPRTSTPRPAYSSSGATPSSPAMRQRAPLPREQMPRQRPATTTAPGRAGAGRRRLRRCATKSAALDGREHVALEHTPSVPACRKLAASMSSAALMECSRRRRNAQVIGDPAVEIGECAGGQRPLLGDRLFGAAQTLAVRPLGWRAAPAAGTGRN